MLCNIYKIWYRYMKEEPAQRKYRTLLNIKTECFVGTGTRCGANQTGQTKKSKNGSHRIKLCIRLFFNITIADSNAFLAPLLRPPERGGEVLFGDGSYYPTPCLLEGLLGYRDACQLQILSSGTQSILMATGPAKKVVARRSRCSSPPGRPARWRGN
jgi:hypothetical protein